MRRGCALALLVIAAQAPAASVADPGGGKGLGLEKQLTGAAGAAALPDPPGEARGIERRIEVEPGPAVPAVAEPAAPSEPAPEPVAAPAPSEPAPAPVAQPAAGDGAAPPVTAPTARPRPPARTAAPRAERPVPERAAARALATAAAPAAAAPVRLSPPARRTAAAPVRAERAGPARPAAREPASPSPVVRILDMVPPELGLALLVLAALGCTLGAAAFLQTARGRRLERTRRALVDDVGVLQSALLPDLPAAIGGARVSAAYRPAAGLAAGGDFFDAFALGDGRLAVVVGDVAGHGRDVVPLTAAVRYGLRAYVEAGLPPRAVLNVAANALAGQLGDRQVTVVVAVYDPASARLTWACAGHWPPALVGVPFRPVIACSSPPLGAGVPTGRRQTTVRLPPGAAAVFFTDGLLDVVSGGDRLGQAGLQRVLDELGPALSAPELIDRVVASSVDQPDDMVAFVVAPDPDAASVSTPAVEELEVDAATLGSPSVVRFLRVCGVPSDRAARAIGEAWAMVGREGSAVLAVSAGRVEITPPAAAVLHAAAGAPAGAARVA